MIRLEMGEDILGSLKAFAKSRGIQAAFFEGIGSLNTARLGHYDFSTKEYKWQIFREDLEILSLSGNISTINKTPLPHAHTTLGKRDFSVIGGHVDEGCLANMVEIGVRRLPGKLVKARDENLGLNAMQLTQKLATTR